VLAAADERASAMLPPIRIEGAGALAEYRGKEVLAQLGIPVPKGGLACDVAEAKRMAADIGYPVVLKAQSADLPHKTEAGGVVVNLADDAALEQGWKRLHDNVARAKPGLVLDGVLVERMGRPGIEMVVGARRDRNWGPVLLVGLGGIWIEALKDVRLLAPDLPERRIIEEIGLLRGAAVLAGLRGAPAVDVKAVAGVVAKLGALMCSRPEIAEVDINPLVAREDGVLALDALVVTGKQEGG
jgi:acyl-CoA synthetase (NDP forming)